MMTPKQRIQRQAVLSVAHHDYEKGLNVHAFFKIRNREMSEDLVQDTFVKTWIYLVKGGKIRLMKAFLYHVLNNLIIDEYRRKKNKTASLDVLLEKGFEPSINDTGRLFNVLDGKEALLLIKQLPPAYQVILRMRYIQDLSLKEISILTGQSKATLAVQIHRGLEKLKILYKPE